MLVVRGGDAAEEVVVDPTPSQGPFEPASSVARRVAPGGWRRGLVGVGLGVVAGLLAAAALPRDPGGEGR